MRETTLEATGLVGATAVVPLAGALIGLFPALTLLGASAVGLPPLVAAPLAIVVLVLVTGALHEDALADCADGFGGGRTREQKLAIMRDSRVGAYGVCAVALSLYIRAVALGATADRSIGLAAAVAIAAGALSRTASLLPLLLLPPARVDGVGATAGRPAAGALAIAAALSLAIVVGTLAPGAGFAPIGVAVVAAVVATLAMCALAWREVGGHTGDVAGATQQVVEIVVYLVFSTVDGS